MKKIVILLAVLFISNLLSGQGILKIFSDTSVIKYELWKKEGRENYLITESLNADDKEGFYRRGLQKMKKGQYGQAISDLKKALSRDETYNTGGIPEVKKNEYLNDVLYAIGYSFYLYDEPDSAGSYFRKIIINDPYFETAWIALSQIEADKGDIDSAVAILRQGETVLPKSASIPFVTGYHYFSDNQNQKAIKVLNQVIHNFPGFEKAYLLLGYIYIIESNPAEALSVLKKYTEINPEDFAVNIWLGIAEAMLNNYEAAYKYLLKFAEKDTVGMPHLSDILSLLEIKTGREKKGFKRLYNSRKNLYSDSAVYRMASPADRFVFPLLKILALDTLPGEEMKYIIKYYTGWYWDNRDVAEAKRNLDEYVKQHPASLFAKQFRLYGYLSLKPKTGSTYDMEITDQINTLMDLTPDDPYLWFFLGYLLQKPDELPDCIEMLKTGSQMIPDYFYPYYFIGTVYFTMKEYDSAIVYCTKVIECCPDFYKAYRIRGNAYYLEKKSRETVNDLAKYLALKPENESNEDIEFFKSILVKNYVKLDMPDSAIRYIKDTKFKDIRNELTKKGTAYYVSRRFNEAIGYFTKTIELSGSGHDHNSETAWVYYQRGNAYLSLGKKSLALNDFLSAIQIDSINVDYLIAAGQAYCGLKKYDPAMAFFDKAGNIEPENENVYVSRAKCLIAFKQYQEAIAYLKTALQTDNNNADIYGQLAVIYYRLGNYNNSMMVSLQAQMTDHRLAYPFYYYILSLARMGMFENTSLLIEDFAASGVAADQPLNEAQIQDMKDLINDGVIDNDQKRQLIIHLAEVFGVKPEKIGFLTVSNPGK